MAVRSTVLLLTIILLLFSPYVARAASGEETRQEGFVAWIMPQIEVAKAALGSEEIQSIPNSIIVAQAALESGWGTSHSARKRGNLFGLMHSTGKPMQFDSPTESIIRYLSTLAENEAYEGFREGVRRGADTKTLIGSLGRYAEEPEYIVRLHKILRSPALRSV